MCVTLIKDFTGMTYYGHIPNTPFAPDPRIEEPPYNPEDGRLLYENAMDRINDACGTWLDICDPDYFDKERCIKLKAWLEDELQKDLQEKLRNIYNILLDYANRAIELGTGIVIGISLC